MSLPSRLLSPSGRRPLDAARVVVVPAGLEPELRMNVSDREAIEERLRGADADGVGER